LLTDGYKNYIILQYFKIIFMNKDLLRYHHVYATIDTKDELCRSKKQAGRLRRCPANSGPQALPSG
jgi:hypothetical protein